ncbi:MAG: hypothetical protein OK455_09995 [Thaumarchaeota archaeon]|nr:hypothetical protein [Nitrososphaerota archaeon]
MGHNNGIGWVYDNRDQVHQEDFVEAYKKLEPHVSLDYNEIAAKEESEKNERAMMELIRDLQRQVAEMKQTQQASAGAQGLFEPSQGGKRDPDGWLDFLRNLASRGILSERVFLWLTHRLSLFKT